MNDPITIAAVAVLVLILLYSAVWLLWWELPKWQLTHLRGLADDKAKADVEDNFRKTAGQLLGGVIVLLGAGLGTVFAYLQFQQQQSSRDLLISNQVSKGFEQLGSDKLVVRLGGIYALEGVMNTSKQYGQPVLEALSAFVRDSTSTNEGDGPPATDVQAALTVIGRRKVVGHVNLAGAHIPHANMFEANLQDVYFFNANLARAYIFRADLTNAHLRNANLRNANLTGADLRYTDLTNADLTETDLRGATVTQAQLDQACGTNVKLDPKLTIKPCPADD